MLCVPAYTHERKPCSATFYSTNFTLDSLLAFTICAQRKIYGLCFTPALIDCRDFLVGLYALGREGGRTYWAAVGTIGGNSNHQNSVEHISRGLVFF